MKQLLQILLQLEEVDRRDEALAGFGQAVSGQLCYLVVDEAEDSVGQWKNVFRRVSMDELGQPLLHLCCGLVAWEGRTNICKVKEKRCTGENGENGVRLREMRFKKDFISFKDSEVCDRKFRKLFNSWPRQCGCADLHWLPFNAFFFHLTCVRTSPKSCYLGWTPNYNARFPKARFLSL